MSADIVIFHYFPPKALCPVEKKIIVDWKGASKGINYDAFLKWPVEGWPRMLRPNYSVTSSYVMIGTEVADNPESLVCRTLYDYYPCGVAWWKARITCTGAFTEQVLTLI